MVGASWVEGVSVRLAVLLVASRVIVPVGLVQGNAQVRVKLAAPVIGTIGSLKSALTMLVLSATFVALAAGATAVTLMAGGAAPVVKCHTAGLSEASPVGGHSCSVKGHG